MTVAPPGAAPVVAVAGEALVDVVVPQDGPPQHAPGGSPLNVAVGLARLGLRAVLLTEVGDDEPGRLVQDHLRASGVVLPPESVRPGVRTSTATARLDATGVASYDFDLRWDLGPRTLPPGAVALHVGSIGAALAPGREAVADLVDQAVAAGLPVSFDPNARPAFTPDRAQAWADVTALAASARLVKCSDEDLAFLQPEADPADVAARLLTGLTELVVVTFGGKGALACSRTATARLASRPVRVVDTVGAGDSFMAALIAQMPEGELGDLGEERLRRLLAAASEVAAVTVSRRGADPPRRDELPAGWPAVEAAP